MNAIAPAQPKHKGSNNLHSIYSVKSLICTFGPFGKGLHIYRFETYCTEDKDIALGDGAYTVFLSTKGTEDDVSPELKRFLDFVGKNEVSEDSFIERLDEKVKEVKANTEWRREYMML